ncbi:MAG: LmbE family N-acetylglucosaminyl deacetylase [Kiritimatiellia bacterium]
MIPLNQPDADLFIPDQCDPSTALSRTTHLGIGAHQDDLEFMAFHGIIACYHAADQWFGGITCTDGSGSSRTGKYAGCTDEEMMTIRRNEQREAAVVGHYSFMAQLDYPSKLVKDPANTTLRDDLIQLIAAAQPEVIYTHNPADKHDTHVAVVVPVIQAIRALPKAQRPKRVLGCEVWRGLDWMMDADKVPLDVSAHENLAMAVSGIFDSQIGGGKRYDLATLGRRRANATFFDSHTSDAAEQLWFAMELTPLIEDDSLDIVSYVLAYLTRFTDDVRAKLTQRIG